MYNVIETILTRRSIRSFLDKQIPLKNLQTILLAGSYAPTGMGMQSWKFTAIQNKNILDKINKAIKTAILTVSNDNKLYSYVNKFIKRAQDESYNFLYNAPTYVIVSNLESNYNSMADSSLAIGNMMLAAHSMGIGSCWLNQLPRLSNIHEIKDLLIELEIPENHKVYGSVVFGYPNEIPKVYLRKDVSKIFI